MSWYPQYTSQLLPQQTTALKQQYVAIFQVTATQLHITSCCIHTYVRTCVRSIYYIATYIFTHNYIGMHVCSSVSLPFDQLFFYFQTIQHNVVISAMISTYKATYIQMYIHDWYVCVYCLFYTHVHGQPQFYLLANPAYADNWLLHYYCILYI